MTSFQWVVVGAGPAGILSVGKLIDHGVDPSTIGWIDPYFQVGDLGRLWSQVPSNTKVGLFIRFLQSCRAFAYDRCCHNFEIHQMDPTQTCRLGFIVDPLQWVSDHLSTLVSPYQGQVEHIAFKNRVWEFSLGGRELTTQHMVLAIGSEPKVLPLIGLDTVPLKHALVKERLSAYCCPDDVFAVFGSSHSAILVLKNLVECGVKRIVNFYLDPLRYAVELDGWVLFDNTGLKGRAAEWARSYLDGCWPPNLERVVSSKASLNQCLPECHKVVYSIGFSRRHLPIIAGLESVSYEHHTGIIAPGLFGVGIAFPELVANPLGIEEYSVGLSKFVSYIDRVMPVWLQYGARNPR